jgi:hypothetical protein
MEIKYVSIVGTLQCPVEESLRKDTYFFDKDRHESFNAPENFFVSERNISDPIWFFQLKPRVIDSAPVYISILKDVFVLPCGIVVTEDGCVVLESIYPKVPENNVTPEDLFISGIDLDIFNNIINKNFQFNNGISLSRAVHGRDIGEQGYFHWIATVLPRVSIVKDRFEGETGPYLMNPHPNFGVEWLKELGIYNEIMRPSSNAIFVRDLIFPCPSQVGQSHYTRNPMLLIDFKRQLLKLGLLEKKENKIGDIVYISRSDAPVRRLSNEDDLISSISDLNVKVCTLTGMSVRDQISLFSTAKAIIGPHGAGLVNILFGDNSTVIELMSTTRTWPGFKVISKMVDSKYCGFVSDIYDKNDTQIKGSGNEDFSVDVNSCSRFIYSCLPT